MQLSTNEVRMLSVSIIAFYVVETKSRKQSGKKSRQPTATKRPTSHKSNVSFSDISEKLTMSSQAEKEYAFTGYNLGDNLLHVSIDHTYLFPRNGALVKIENLTYVDQDNCVQISLMYKGDTFAVNFLNPMEIVKEENKENQSSVEKEMTREGKSPEAGRVACFLFVCLSRASPFSSS